MLLFPFAVIAAAAAAAGTVRGVCVCLSRVSLLWWGLCSLNFAGSKRWFLLLQCVRCAAVETQGLSAAAEAAAAALYDAGSNAASAASIPSPQTAAAQQLLQQRRQCLEPRH